MRKIIVALQISLDGYIEDVNGDAGWVDSWGDDFDIIPRCDTLLLGAAMYPGYERYWGAIHADPTARTPYTDRLPFPEEVEYARYALATPHVVLSTTMTGAEWPNTRIIRSIDDVRRLKEADGKDIHAVGGAKLAGSLLNAGLVDELTVIVWPLLLGGGKTLFGEATSRHGLSLRDMTRHDAGAVKLTYAVA